MGFQLCFFLYFEQNINRFSAQGILEFGLGESTKFISTFIYAKNPACRHLVLEENEKWKNRYLLSNKITSASKIEICKLYEELVNGHTTFKYEGLDEKLKDKFDLYIIDGPIGSKHFSRYDLTNIANSLEPGDEFIIIIDDFQRIGEKETVKVMMEIFDNKTIKVYQIGFSGIKEILVLTTEKYKSISTF